MLQLKNITKIYPAGNESVHALRGIDLAFRRSEFVSILGPSGCGKTTMLNIIGGLDHYTDGDLVINGTSTKLYKDRDWDAYRNHSVGFVFQSYNLIPHQSVLRNVELALSLSGVSKAERKKRARAALERVGLGDQLRKRPAEMSGGQMQRVAIARAIVNNPDIVLADEPTGALDSETSVQVMEILKEISKDRLVIMVTHNPEIAEQYSTRIVRMLDGKITSDSAPLTAEELKELEPKAEPQKKAKKEKKPSLSFATSFGLSLNNLFTKKGRTALTYFAGSIGIIGIALIYAVSQGMTSYINTVQEDTLSSYPLTLEANHTDLGSLMMSFMNAASASAEHEDDAVYQKTALYDLVNALTSIETKENDLEAFKNRLEAVISSEDEENAKYRDAISGVQYTYQNNLTVYAENVDGDIILSDSQEMIRKILAKSFASFSSDMTGQGGSGNMSSMMSMSATSLTMWQEMLSANDGSLINPLLIKQYDLIHGAWPNEYNEIVLVLDENNELDDMTLYALGLKSEQEIDEIVDAALNKKELPVTQKSWSYEEICGMKLRVVIGADAYKLDEKTGHYYDLRTTDAGLRYLYDNALELKVTGIIRPSEDAVSSMLTGSIGYTKALTEYMIEKTAGAPAVIAQLADEGTDIFTGLPFRDNASLTDEDKAADFKAFVAALDTKGKADAYKKIVTTPDNATVEGFIKNELATKTREEMESTLIYALTAQTGMSEAELSEYVTEMNDESLASIYSQILAEGFKMQYAQSVMQQIVALSPEQLAGMLDMQLPTYTTEQCAFYYDSVLTFSGASYGENIYKLGYVELDKPHTINLYASTFENKDVIEELINDYNSSVDEMQEITYTDYVGLMMSSVTTIINAITYVLIAFVAVSLVVSSIMIGVVTLISVQERTKEIGILRAIGASKKNVSAMFNAETVIIGFASGLTGVLVTYLLCIPINLILHALTKIENLSAQLPVSVALILVAISVALTLFAGIIPSRSAAKKDPVVALRTE
ncbi:MAG: ABC transporter ATP-binding protein/permease [Clostridia bacterium]|nr:ABC transporter ATP-binding protein/permease [Clostridia bacterium]